MKYVSAAAALAVFLGLFPASAPARADSILNEWLPSVFGPPDQGPKPEDTLQAPFGQDQPAQAVSKSQAGLMNIYEMDKDSKIAGGLGQPHRNTEQVSEWLTNVVTQAMTIDPEKYDPSIFGALFTPYALQEYQNYLISHQTVEMLKTNNMKLTAFAESRPVLVQEGQLDGTYHWFFRVPVMLTYYDRVTSQALKGSKKPVAQTERVVINVQIGRASLKTAAEGMIIERWSVTSG